MPTKFTIEIETEQSEDEFVRSVYKLAGVEPPSGMLTLNTLYEADERDERWTNFCSSSWLEHALCADLALPDDYAKPDAAGRSWSVKAERIEHTSWQVPDYEAKFAAFMGDWTIKAFVDRWREDISRFPVCLDPVIEEIEIYVPDMDWTLPTEQHFWCERGDVTSLQLSLQSKAISDGNLRYLQLREPEGTSNTAYNLWHSRHDAAAVAAVLIYA